MDLFYDLFPKVNDRSLMRSTVEVKDNEYIISTELPGLVKENIKITLEDGVLDIIANRELNEDKEFYLDESYYGELSRQFKLKDVKDAEIKATYTDGILKVFVPKLTEAETKKFIAIE